MLGPDGKPVVGCDGLLAQLSQGHPSTSVAIPKDQKAQPIEPARISWAKSETDANGRFSLTADFDPDRYNHQDGSNVVLW